GQDGLPHIDVWSFHRERAGGMHIGTGAGVALVQAGKAGESLSVPLDLRPAKAQVSSLVRDGHGALWISTFTGSLLRQDARGGLAAVVAARLPMIYRLLVDAQGRVWLLTERGIFVVDGARPDAKPRRVDTPALFPGQEGPLMAFNGCADRSGQLWITSSKGILRIVDGDLTPLPLFEQDGRTPARRAYNLMACGADGSTWLAGGESRGYALARWKDGRGVLSEVVPPHLADRLVMALHEDRRGWIWVATDGGVAVTDTARWRLLRQDSGLLWNDSNQGALYEDPDGSLWIGTSRGAVQVEHPELLFDHLDLSIAVNSISYGGTTVRQPRSSLQLPWSGQSLRVSMAGLQYESRHALRFHSRLLGLSEEWTVSDSAEQVYTALPPGQYVLEMKIENDDLQARSPVQSIEIVVTPPWWRSVGFYALLALASALLVYALDRWRVRKVYRRQQELERLVAERTEALAASHEQMRELAMKDGLTGVWNRRALTDILARERARALRERSTLTLVLVDADHFKRVNDEHGHLAGDEVLRELARRLVGATRATDAVGRYGGEEFVIALPGLSPADPACVARIEAIHHSIGDQPFVIGAELQLAVTCSFGVACLRGAADAPGDVESTLAQADAALYRAKERGRNRIEYAEGERPAGAQVDAQVDV
ncbi:MAG TPA: diguanylate cyclase, partial [Burkholderiaceae bacterium]|nr:diguanylate cyclase [Burkholderiaceae bacterium]